jgi:hypothetical protein
MLPSSSARTVFQPQLKRIARSIAAAAVRNLRTISAEEAKWLEKYERLCDYESKMPLTMRNTTEICNISSSDLESVFEKRYQKDPVLRRWVNAQRQKYRREKISMERVQLLEKVEGFVWDVKEARWFEMFSRLSLFAEQHHGSCIVPQNYAADPQLACWVANQRQRKHQLTAERIQVLDSLGFVWDVQEIKWLANFQIYKTMFFGDGETSDDRNRSSNDNKNKNTLDDKTEENEERKARKEQQQMIDWVLKQRQSNRNGTMSPYRKNLLNGLIHPADGSRFAWDLHGQNWMEMYDELKEFRKTHKHVMVPTRSTRYDGSIVNDNDNDNGNDSDSNPISTTASSSSISSSSIKQLGTWVANQRRSFKEGTLSKKRQTLLDEIDFVWDAPEAIWNDQYQRLLDYQKVHIAEGKERLTSTLVPQPYPRDPQLAFWVKKQRQNRKNGVLTAEHLELLETIGFVWDASPSSPSP